MVIIVERCFPLLVTVSIGAFDDDTYETYMRHFRSVAERKTPFVTLSEARFGAVPTAQARRRLADMAQEIEAITRDLNLATSAVLKSSLMVGAARAVSWIRGDHDEVHYVSSAVEAHAWLVEQARAGGVTLPEQTLALARQLDQMVADDEAPRDVARRLTAS